MPTRILWNSPPLPDALIDDEEAMWALYEKVSELFVHDQPSRSDIRTLLVRYNESTAAERDAIDAAFVWMTGCTLSRIAGMTAPKP